VSQDPITDAEGKRRSPALTFDPAVYREFIDDTGWTDAQKDEFIEALWHIIVSFVDLGFDLHPLQHVISDPKTLELDSPSMVACGDNTDITNSNAAERPMGRAAERTDS
jgi:hypothetical protein